MNFVELLVCYGEKKILRFVDILKECVGYFVWKKFIYSGSMENRIPPRNAQVSIETLAVL